MLGYIASVSALVTTVTVTHSLGIGPVTAKTQNVASATVSVMAVTEKCGFGQSVLQTATRFMTDFSSFSALV